MSRQPQVPHQSPHAAHCQKLGDKAWADPRNEKINGELFAITYGVFVNKLVTDAGGLGVSSNSLLVEERIENVNKQLADMGHRIGCRLIDEFMAKSAAPPCRSFLATGDSIAKIGMRMFLGINATAVVVSTGAEGKGDDAVSPTAAASTAPACYHLVFDENPLNCFVELPDGAMRATLWYSNVLVGVIRGALGQVGVTADVRFVRDVLRGDQTHEIRVTEVVRTAGRS
jgi:hypothetical protein